MLPHIRMVIMELDKDDLRGKKGWILAKFQLFGAF